MCNVHDHIDEAISSNKNFWQEIRKLGLISTTSDSLHGFLPDELNDHFANICVSPREDTTESLNQILSASPEGLKYKSVNEKGVILAVSHFRSQVRGEDGIPQSFISKALSFIVPYLARIFSASLTRGIFPSSWKKLEFWP